jgi:hypothetical protein
MPHFGFAPKRYLLDVGTHLVARADGQPLTGETVDTMASFCRFHLLAYFEKCSEDSSVEYFDGNVTKPLQASSGGHGSDHT